MATNSVVAGISSSTSDPVYVDGSNVTQPVSGTVTAQQSTAANLKAEVVGASADNSTNVSTKLPVLAAVATSAAPSYTNTNQVPLSVDTSGSLRVTGSVTASNPSVGTDGAAKPGSDTLIGGSDGTNLQAIRVYDTDTGVGTEWTLGTILRKSASGGSVEAGTDTAPLITDRPNKATYTAVVTGLAAAASATDIITITGSGTKTVRVLSVQVAANKTSNSVVRTDILKRSTANTGGTSSTETATPLDSNNAAATATVRSYTANPTTGTLVGKIATSRNSWPASAGQPMWFQYNFQDVDHGQQVVLRGTTEVLAVNLGGVTVAGSSIDAIITWTEE